MEKFSKAFSVDDMKKIGLYRYVYDFSVDYDSIDVDHILDVDRYSMNKYDIKIFRLTKKIKYLVFMLLLSCI